jgi:hypothetical protein
VAVKPSGLYYPNKMARLYVLAVEESIGAEAMQAVYQLAGVPLEHYPPPNNFAKEFDFAYYGAIGAALEKIYGARGVRGLTVHAGRASLSGGLAEFAPIIGINELVLKKIPLEAKMRIGLRGLAATYTKFSDLTATLTETDEHFVYTIHQCPICWGRSSAKPVCHGAIGILEEGLRWVSEGKSYQIEEVACHAAGAENCVFHIRKTPLE